MESYDHFNFSSASVVLFRESRYIMRLNRTSEWKVMTFWISRELPSFNFEHRDILCPQIGYLCEKFWPFKFFESFHFSILSVSISYVPKSDIRVKRYSHLNFSSVFVFQFCVSRYIMLLNRTFERKVMTNWIFRELPSLNYESLDILRTWIEHPN